MSLSREAVIIHLHNSPSADMASALVVVASSPVRESETRTWQ